MFTLSELEHNIDPADIPTGLEGLGPRGVGDVVAPGRGLQYAITGINTYNEGDGWSWSITTRDAKGDTRIISDRWVEGVDRIISSPRAPRELFEEAARTVHRSRQNRRIALLFTLLLTLTVAAINLFPVMPDPDTRVLTRAILGLAAGLTAVVGCALFSAARTRRPKQATKAKPDPADQRPAD